jgi:phosphoribosyl 1,2-cyclic phosphodiesterase
MEIIFWGSRGSVPCFSKQKVHFGTNTSCIEVRVPGEERILFDAGTGIVSVGVHMERQGLNPEERIHLFFSHFHWDHIQGFPFFRPLYRKDITVNLYGRPRADGRKGIEEAFSKQMTDPFFPLPFEALPANLVIVPVTDPVHLVKSVVTPFSLNHPQHCYAYVVEAEGKKLVYATDTEPDGGDMDALLIRMAEGADILVMDANNSLEESSKRKGWGHSNWQECAYIAREARVGRLILFHHDPFHDDDEVQDKQRQAQKIFPDTICAYEGLRVRIDGA